ncbi:type VI secretion system baseplate subunit TssG [Commensalibacter nepenthis]|uniref:Type VI secretion system baseplate subunit TssG n=1 Tax=Commensalibacter nepenthis TaxID=3043872 RepID=A0ABT6Q4M4_9PROT|nr:type VI secretion system baseplate subunit TssG [Commensalibacter sp. TBRC 10068]MDI2111749.1 type VI secretion system baseplate subunit TssG [Commensalibacter sp. TBRC 10068]
MERKPQSENFWLVKKIEDKIISINFYRFCQLIEKTDIHYPALGTTSLLKNDLIRFRSVEDMGFPVSEFKEVQWSKTNPSLPPTIRTTFLGLYGIDSPLPTIFLDDIAQKREGYESVTSFLDIFHHRMITQYYRIWRKYSYPASFQSGGTDETSQCLLGLIGLGIPGTQKHIATPISRFLALLSVMRLPTRNAEGLSALVSVLTKNTKATVKPHSVQHIPLLNPIKLSSKTPVHLNIRHTLGKTGRDVNSQIALNLYTEDFEEAKSWLPGGVLFIDFLILLRVYLGWRYTAKIQLTVPKRVLPDAKLNKSQIQLGRTGILGLTKEKKKHSKEIITVKIGGYKGLKPLSKVTQAEKVSYVY